MDRGRGDSLRAAPRKVVATAQAVAGPDRGLPEGEVKSVSTLGRLTPADVGCWTGWRRRMLDLGCWLNLVKPIQGLCTQAVAGSHRGSAGTSVSTRAGSRQRMLDGGCWLRFAQQSLNGFNQHPTSDIQHPPGDAGPLSQ